jgi:hypothetical protein
MVKKSKILTAIMRREARQMGEFRVITGMYEDITLVHNMEPVIRVTDFYVDISMAFKVTHPSLVQGVLILYGAGRKVLYRPRIRGVRISELLK